MSLPFSSLSAHSHSPNSEHGAPGRKLAAGLEVEVGSPGENPPRLGPRQVGQEGRSSHHRVKSGCLNKGGQLSAH